MSISTPQAVSSGAIAFDCIAHGRLHRVTAHALGMRVDKGQDPPAAQGELVDGIALGIVQVLGLGQHQDIDILGDLLEAHP